MNNLLRVGIIGCGRIGTKRAHALPGGKVVAVHDIQLDRASALAKTVNATIEKDWKRLVQRHDIDVVIVSTTNEMLTPITLGAIDAGKAVLVEKPAAHTTDELRLVMSRADKKGVPIRVGFNLRYHPAIRKSIEMHQRGLLGDIMFVRGHYGHGGRVGYDTEWRANPRIAGGGVLMDLGVHLIDLSRIFLGEIAHVEGYVGTYFWNMPVEDNSFFALRNSHNQLAWLHVSCTDWKNIFSFEIYGKDAKLIITGLGGSYGTERLTYYRMSPSMGPPDTTIWEYPHEDHSWSEEFSEFSIDIHENRKPEVGIPSALATLEVIEKLYANHH